MRINPRSSNFQTGRLSKRLAQSTRLSESSSDTTHTPLDALETLNRWASSESLQRESVRWNLDAMPLRVCIEPLANSPELEGLLSVILRQWEAASLGAVRFKWVPYPADDSEDILIRWSDTPVLGREYEVGHANRTIRGQGRIVHVDITLLTAPVIDGHLTPGQRQERLQATLLHELGHALGLEHSEHPLDVMHYRGWKNRWLSEQDCQRLQTLYQANRLSQL